jgi:hypothetical protein
MGFGLSLIIDGSTEKVLQFKIISTEVIYSLNVFYFNGAISIF